MKPLATCFSESRKAACALCHDRLKVFGQAWHSYVAGNLNVSWIHGRFLISILPLFKRIYGNIRRENAERTLPVQVLVEGFLQLHCSSHSIETLRFWWCLPKHPQADSRIRSLFVAPGFALSVFTWCTDAQDIAPYITPYSHPSC